jgi:tetratricopeptide (TPR) repeat protein
MATNEKTIEQLRALSQKIDDTFESGEREKGESLLHQAIEEAEKKDQAYHLFFKGEYEGYINENEEERCRFFKEALEKHPTDNFLFRNLGNALAIKGDQDAAIVLFDKAIELNPKDYNAWQNKGVSLSEKGDQDAAIVLFDKAIELNPKDYNAWRNKGVSLSKKGDEDAAIALFDKAIELNPKDYRAWRQKGVSSSKKGDNDAAIALFDKAIELNPKDYDAWRQKGVSFSKKGDNDAAIALFDKAIELNPKDWSSFYNKSITLFNQNEIDKALENASKALELNPNEELAKRFLSFLAPYKTPKDATCRTVNVPVTEGFLACQTQGIVSIVRSTMEQDFETFLREMKEAQTHIDAFINENGRANPAGAWFHILRKWNSYTPILPTDGPERSVGGGYFLQSFGAGIAIDPGFGFIDNFFKAGFRVADITAVVVTHAHNDHNSDLESLLTLFYKHNSDRADKKKVDLYLNTGSFQKFSGLLNLRSTDYLGKVYILMPDHEYAIGTKTCLKALKAYHDEVITKDYAVGLWFSIGTDDGERNIIISSDTSLYPPDETDKKKERVIVEEEKEIWKTYGIGDRKVHLLIPHLGSIKEREFTKAYKDANEMFYRNHLGILGTAVLISGIKPELAIISEFGEELRSIQEKLINLIEETVKRTTDDKVKLLPGDVGLIYDVPTGSICCQVSGAMHPHREILYGCTDDTFLFYHKSAKDKPAQFNRLVKEWEEKRRIGNLHCHTQHQDQGTK